VRSAASPAKCHVLVCENFDKLMAALPADTILAIDMPIGLPERVGPGGRAPEVALRPLLGARQSSVFSLPSRAAVFAETYEESCRLAEATSDPPRKVSKQAFNLFPRVRDIDAALRADPSLAARVFECHPEGAFRFMAGAPLTLPKKVKSAVHPPGMAERRALLAAQGYPDHVLDGPLPPGVGRDDLLDACAASWSAARIASGSAQCFPAAPGRDPNGLQMAIRA
jgi:predicted RNase H-like nuclease